LLYLIPSRRIGQKAEPPLACFRAGLAAIMAEIAKYRATRAGKMKLPQAGGCQCGKIRYEITEAPQLVYTCHCTDCQRLTGSAFSLGIVVAEAGFRLSGIEPRPLQRTADSGRINSRALSVCPRTC
jgi:hypothetical protein